MVADGPVLQLEGAWTHLAFLYRDPTMDRYVFFIFHDKSAMEDLFPLIFHAMRFEEPVGTAGML